MSETRVTSVALSEICYLAQGVSRGKTEAVESASPARGDTAFRFEARSVALRELLKLWSVLILRPTHWPTGPHVLATFVSS